MKRILLLLAAVAMLVLVLAPGAQAQATNETTNETALFTATFFNPCTGEDVYFEGHIHLLFHHTVDSTGGDHGKFNANVQGEGVGLSSGDRYILTQTHNDQINNDSPLEGEQTRLNVTFVSHLHLTRQGETGTEDDYRAHFLFLVTQNANEEITAEVVNGEIECQ
jgi:hypothetical protein